MTLNVLISYLYFAVVAVDKVYRYGHRGAAENRFTCPMDRKRQPGDISKANTSEDIGLSIWHVMDWSFEAMILCDEVLVGITCLCVHSTINGVILLSWRKVCMIRGRFKIWLERVKEWLRNISVQDPQDYYD